MFYIEGSNGTRTRDSRDLEVHVETFEECERIISFYFDMGYDAAYTIVNAETDERKTITQESYTAWQLCGDWWWVGKFYAKVKGGVSLYEDATAANNQQSVVFRRLRGLHQINRRLTHDQEMELVPITAGK